MKVSRYVVVTACVLILAIAIAACGSSSDDGGGSGDPIKIGTSLSKTGALGELGANQAAGYQYAVENVNKEGGIDVGGEKRKVELSVSNNQSEPQAAAEQVRSLILKDEVDALLGSCAPDFVIPQGLVADRERIPYVDTCVPQRAFVAGNPEGWTYSWANFFDEHEQAANFMKVLASAPSNKKVALFTDTEPDGKVERPVYAAAAEAEGLEVVGDYTFPPDTTDFSSFIAEAKSAGAELIMAQVIPPAAIALVKQIKSLKYTPQVVAISKGADTAAFPEALGPISNGTVMDEQFLPGKYPGSEEFNEAMSPKLGDPVSVDFAALGYAAAQILFQAIEEAESTDPDAVNEALANLSMTTILGPVKFNEDHVNSTPMKYAITQWVNGGELAYIEPSLDGAKLEAPPSGLK